VRRVALNPRILVAKTIYSYVDARFIDRRAAIIDKDRNPKFRRRGSRTVRLIAAKYFAPTKNTGWCFRTFFQRRKREHNGEGGSSVRQLAAPCGNCQAGHGGQLDWCILIPKAGPRDSSSALPSPEVLIHHAAGGQALSYVADSFLRAESLSSTLPDTIDSSRRKSRSGRATAVGGCTVAGGTAAPRRDVIQDRPGAFAAAIPSSQHGKKIVMRRRRRAGAKIATMILGFSRNVLTRPSPWPRSFAVDSGAVRLASTSRASLVVTSYCPVPGPVPASPANNDYKPGFAAALMLKDLRLSQEAAKAAGAATPLGAHAESIYEAFEKAGHGGVDFSGIINHVRGLAQKT